MLVQVHFICSIGHHPLMDAAAIKLGTRTFDEMPGVYVYSINMISIYVRYFIGYQNVPKILEIFYHIKIVSHFEFL